MRARGWLVAVAGATMVAGTLLWPGTAGAVGPADLASVVYYETEFDDGNFSPDTQGPASGMQGLQDVVITPDGKHAYVSGGLDNAIARFSRDPSTGLLTFLGETTHNPPAGPLIESARKIAISPDSKHLYVTAITSNAVSVFTRVEATGDLVFVQALVDDQGGVTGLGGAKAAAVSPDGRQVYVVGFADDAVVVFDRDATTGVLTHSQTLFDGVGGVDGLDSADDVKVSPDGKHVYVVSGKSLPNLTQGDDAIVAFARDTDPISPTFGELTFVEALFDGVGGINGLHEVQNLFISPDGKHVYTAAETDAAIGTDPDDDWLAVFSRDPTTGKLALVETHNSVDRPECGITSFSSTTADIEVAAGGVFVYATDPRENTLVEFVRSASTGKLSNEKATCRGAKRDGSDFENELFGGLLTPVTLAVDPTGTNVYVGGFSPAAVNVFGRGSFVNIGKDAIPDGPQEFDFDLSWVDPQDGPTSLGPLPVSDPGNPDNPLPVGPLEPGAYDLTELVPAGWRLSDIACTDPSGGTTVDLPGERAAVDLGLDETVACTFTNRQTGTIVIVKDGLADPPAEFTFRGLPKPADSFVLDDDPGSPTPSSRTFANLLPGNRTISEDARAGWKLTAITCDDPATTVDLPNRRVTVGLDAGETVTCTFRNRLRDDDADGVPDLVEDGAPNDGDGNGDGVKDSQQANVGSVPDAATGRYATIEAPAGTQIVDLEAQANPDPANSPAGVRFPWGFFSFRITGLAPGATVAYSYILEPGGPAPEAFYFYGPEPTDASDHFWVFSTATSSTEVRLQVTDGKRGDLDLTADGVVTDPGAPAVLAAAAPEFFGFHDRAKGLWHLPKDANEDESFYFGDPWDQGIVGDWDCDGLDTVGVYRSGRVLLRNANTPGSAQVAYPLGEPGDVALAGDFDGDGCDTVSLYRPSQARFLVYDGLSGAALTKAYVFGNPFDVPFAGDFDGDGLDTFGVQRQTTGQAFLRNSHTSGIADVVFTFGNPFDRMTSGDWDGDGDSTPGVLRPGPGLQTGYLRNTNTSGIADQTTTRVLDGIHFPVSGVYF